MLVLKRLLLTHKQGGWRIFVMLSADDRAVLALCFKRCCAVDKEKTWTLSWLERVSTDALSLLLYPR